ncbi:MAG: heme exporter protein CcmD [Gammaproteobacteria bacterium]
MYFTNITDMLHMGGYATYVWPAYGIVLAVLVANILIPLQRRHRLQKNDESET